MKIQTLLAFSIILSTTSAQALPVYNLFDYGFNIDGAVSMPSLGDPVPAEVDLSLFDDIMGLGRISVSITGSGAHTFDAFFDHEIDETINTFFNEYGAAVGSAAAGQSWEIDEPGFVFGDIFTNFENSALDNTNAVPALLEDDVSMAMGWDFTLAAGETATIDLYLDESRTISDFYLYHNDADSFGTIILSSVLTIDGGVPVPEPSILLLMGIGLAGLLASRRSYRFNRIS